MQHEECTGIYIGRCLPTNKVYVGSALRWIKRTESHQKDLNKGKHCNVYLQAAWNKYGAASFTWELAEWCDASRRFELEQWWVDLLNSADHRFGFNIAYPVKQGVPSQKMSGAHRAYWEILTEEERAERVAYMATVEHQERATAGKQSEEFRQRQSAGAKRQWEDEAVAEAIRTKTRARLAEQLADPEKWAPIGAKISAKAVARWEEPEYRERGLKQIKAASDKARAVLDDPVKMAERLALLEDNRAKAAAAIKARWADPEFRARRTAQLKLPRKRRPKQKD